MRKSAAPSLVARNKGSESSSGENVPLQSSNEPPPPPPCLSGVKACFSLGDTMEMVELLPTFKELGGVVAKMTDNPTHLVYDDGDHAVFYQAKANGLKIVNKQWIGMCAHQKARMPEQFAPPVPPAEPLNPVSAARSLNFEGNNDRANEFLALW